MAEWMPPNLPQLTAVCPKCGMHDIVRNRGGGHCRWFCRGCGRELEQETTGRVFIRDERTAQQRETFLRRMGEPPPDGLPEPEVALPDPPPLRCDTKQLHRLRFLRWLHLHDRLHVHDGRNCICTN